MQHYMRGGRDAPQDIHFIVIGRMGSDCGTLSGQRLVHVDMHGRRRHLVFQFFRVNMVERRLQESAQEYKNTDDDAGSPHSSH